MKLSFPILAMCFLMGCPIEKNIPAPPPATEKTEAQKTEDKPNSDEQIDPFGLKDLLRKPLEALPSAMPENDKDIFKQITEENEVSYQGLEGTWYGGIFYSPNKRVYLQFRSDKSFSYGCVDMSTNTFASARLLTGKYSIEDKNLQLQTQFHDEYINEQIIEASLSSKLNGIFAMSCGDHSWQGSGSTLAIPLRQFDLNTIVLFEHVFSNAVVFLVRK